MNYSKKPSFFLTTAGEYKLLSQPRACWFIRRLKDVNRDDYMVVKIDPPLIGQSFGLGRLDITELLLSTRHQGFSLFSTFQGPMEVYVARFTCQLAPTAEIFERDHVQLIAWGTVFKDIEAATLHARELETELI